ncbi:MAG: ferredoxin [Calditrichaeota bacterium]|nr:MAG: ferredoxin [Calditrichota bacterium]
MIKVDDQKCCYCAGCVPTCPENSIFLWDTRLTIDETCITCNLCVIFCPVSALSIAEDEKKIA